MVLVGVFTDIEPETLNSKASDTERRKLADAAELFLFEDPHYSMIKKALAQDEGDGYFRTNFAPGKEKERH